MAELERQGLDGAREDEEELDETAYKTTKDAILFAIEVSHSMLEGGSLSPTLAALNAANQLMQQRIISHPSDVIGVLLYGTKERKFEVIDSSSAGALGYPHCYLFIDLNKPAAEDVKALNTLIEDDAENVLTPSDEEVLMSNVLFCANQIFTSRAANFTSRRLFIITNNDDPHSNNKQQKSAATVRAKDLFDLGVIIELFPISKADHEFDKSLFYNDLTYSSLPTETAGVSAPRTSLPKNGKELLESLLSEINSKSIARRALFSSLPLEIGPGLTISVSGYLMFKRQEINKSCWIHQDDGKAEVATATTIQTAGDTDKVLQREEVRRAYKFGGDNITFSADEAAKLKYFGDPGLRVIGFKSMDLLPVWANLKPPTFVYPSEEDYVGSTRTFAALHQKLWKSSKFALIWFVARKNAIPTMAALIAGQEEKNATNQQIIPAGLWLIPIPFVDDIRQLPETTHLQAPGILIDQARIFIEQLKLVNSTYDPDKYPNPSVQWHYRILQAIALDEELPEFDPKMDKTLPKYKTIEKRIGVDASEWQKELEAQYIQVARGVKREASVIEQKPIPKRQKAESKSKK